MPISTASFGTSVPHIADATEISRLRAAALFSFHSSSEEGVKLFSNPLGVTISTGRPWNWAHSRAVMSLTVVKTSAFLAEIFSSEWRATTPKRLAISSPSYPLRFL